MKSNGRASDVILISAARILIGHSNPSHFQQILLLILVRKKCFCSLHYPQLFPDIEYWTFCLCYTPYHL